MADGYLTFDTKLNTSGFQKGIGSISSMFGKLGAIAAAALSVAAITNFGKASVQAASQMEAKFKGLEFLMRANGRSMQEATTFIQDFTADGLVPMTSAYEAYKNMVSRGYDTSQIEQMMNVMKDAAVYNRQGQFTMGEAIEKATMGLRMENSLLTDSVGIQKNVAKMWQEYAKEIGTTANNLTLAQKRQAEFNGFMREGGVFAGAAAEYTNSYAGRTAALSASFLNLKVAVGNAIIPILNAIIPAISQVVLWFTKLFNIVGQVMNLLFGTAVGMADAEAAMADNAEATAAAMGDTAANTEAAGKAAKGALASFDKLNVLSQDTAGGGTGAGGGEAGLPVEEEQGLFPELEDSLDALDEKLAAFKEKLLAFFEPLREPFARLKEAFLTLGQTIWAGLGWAWENILFPFITWIVQSVSPLALDIITGALNVLNEVLIAISPLFTWLWEEILQPLGQWAGEAFIQALTWIAEKLTEVSDWISTHQETVQNLAIILGSFAAAWMLVNGAIAIWNAIGVIATAVTTAFGAAVAFLTSPIGLVILAIGAVIAIVILLIKYWDEVKAWAISTWEKIKEVWGAVADWFDENVIQPVVAFFKGLWESVKGFFVGLWDDIVAIWDKVATWFDEHVIQPIVDFFSPILNTIYIIFYDLWLLIKYVWDKVATWFKENVIDPIVTFFQKLWEDVSGFFSDLWEDIKEIWNIVSDWFKEHVTDPVVEWFKGVWTDVSGFFGNLWTDIKTVWETVSGWFQQNVIDPVVTAWDTATTKIGEFFTNMWDGVKDGAKIAINWVIEKINGFLSGIVGGINVLIGKWNSVPIPGWLELPLLTVPQIPLLATGAVIPPNAPFMAVVGDQRSGTNIEAPEALIRQIVREEVGGMGNQNITITFGGTMGELVRQLKPHIERENSRVGNTMLAQAVRVS